MSTLANDAEAKALELWRESYPHAAMTTLHGAGYDEQQRRAFLVRVARCSRYDAEWHAVLTESDLVAVEVPGE